MRASFADAEILRNMARRKYISLLLLAVYLLTTGGAAYASLSCRCLTEMHACVSAHGCCACANPCAHARRVCDDGAVQTWEAPCCDDRHSTEIELYVGASHDDENEVRCAVLALPHCLAAAQAARLSAPKFRKERIERPVARIRPSFVAVAGLRAPPVLV